MATPHAYPWAVALYKVYGRHSYFLCGASIISERYILTAAHCVTSMNGETSPSDFKVKVGAHDLETSGRLMEVEQLIVHEHYSPRQQNDDIALLKLKSPLDFNGDLKITPICLPKPDISDIREVGTMTTLVGWGRHYQNDYMTSSLLNVVQVPLSNQKQCKRTYNNLIGSSSLFNWDNVVCAAYEDGGKDTCQGDSGGPMTLPNDNIYQQIGIVSFGYGCAQKDYPGVYTYVPHYLNWIGAHMNLNQNSN